MTLAATGRAWFPERMRVVTAPGLIALLHTGVITTIRGSVLIILAAAMPAICAVILLLARYIVLSGAVG